MFWLPKRNGLFGVARGEPTYPDLVEVAALYGAGSSRLLGWTLVLRCIRLRCYNQVGLSQIIWQGEVRAERQRAYDYS